MRKEEVLSNPRLYVPYWFAQKKLAVKANLILSDQQQAFDLDLVFNAMWLDYRQELNGLNAGADESLRGFPEKDLTKALEEFLEVKRQEALQEIRESVKCTGENLDELKRFLT